MGIFPLVKVLCVNLFYYVSVVCVIESNPKSRIRFPAPSYTCQCLHQTVRVVNLVLELVGDQNLEVRRKAGTVLGGLLHCTFIPPGQRDQLLTRFLAASSSKIPKKAREGEDKAAWQLRQSEAVVKRHAGTNLAIQDSCMLGFDTVACSMYLVCNM